MHLVVTGDKNHLDQEITMYYSQAINACPSSNIEVRVYQEFISSVLCLNCVTSDLNNHASCDFIPFLKVVTRGLVPFPCRTPAIGTLVYLAIKVSTTLPTEMCVERWYLAVRHSI